MPWTNYDNHCKYCDGVEEIEAHVQNAINEGVVSLGFSSYVHVGFENGKWKAKPFDDNEIYWN